MPRYLFLLASRIVIAPTAIWQLFPDFFHRRIRVKADTLIDFVIFLSCDL